MHQLSPCYVTAVCQNHVPAGWLPKINCLEGNSRLHFAANTKAPELQLLKEKSECRHQNDLHDSWKLLRVGTRNSGPQVTSGQALSSDHSRFSIFVCCCEPSRCNWCSAPWAVPTPLVLFKGLSVLICLAGSFFLPCSSIMSSTLFPRQVISSFPLTSPRHRG